MLLDSVRGDLVLNYYSTALDISSRYFHSFMTKETLL